MGLSYPVTPRLRGGAGGGIGSGRPLSVVAPLRAPAAPRASGTVRRWAGPVAFGLTAAILGLATWEYIVAWEHAAVIGQVGGDLAMYLDRTRLQLSGGSSYP